MPFKIPACNRFLAACFQNRVTSTISTLIAGTALAATAHKLYQSPAVQNLLARVSQKEILPIFYQNGMLTRVGVVATTLVAVKGAQILLNKIFPRPSSAELTQRITTLTQNLSDAQAKIPTQEQVDQAREKTEQAAKHIAELTGQIEDLQTKNETASKTQEDLQTTKYALERLQETHNTVSTTSTQKLQDVEKQVVELQQAIQTKTEELTALQTAKEEAAEKLTALQAEHALCANAVTKARTDAAEAARARIAELEKSIASVKEERELANTQAKEAIENLTKIQQDLSQLSQQDLAARVKTLEPQVAGLKALSETLKSENSQLKTRLDTATKSAKIFQGQAENLEKQVAELTRKLEQANQDVLQEKAALENQRNSERRPSIAATPSPRNSAQPSPTASTTTSTVTNIAETHTNRPPRHTGQDPVTQDTLMDLKASNRSQTDPNKFAMLQQPFSGTSSATPTTTTTTTPPVTATKTGSPEKKQKKK